MQPKDYLLTSCLSYFIWLGNVTDQQNSLGGMTAAGVSSIANASKW